MKKLLALIHARNLEFYRDRSALVWTLIFPFVVLAGFAYGYSGKSDPLVKIRVAGPELAEGALARKLRDLPGIELHPVPDADRARHLIARYQADLVLFAGSAPGRVAYSIQPDSDAGRLAEVLLIGARDRLSEARPELEKREIPGRKVRYADWLLPGLLAMNIMFGSMFGVGYVIVRYRKNGVLKRLRATPLSAFQFLSAQVVSRMLLMVVTSVLVVAGAMLLIGFRPANGWACLPDLLLFLAAGSSTMISVGLLVAARISNEEVADGVLNLLTWPMIFLSGIWFSLDGASGWVLAVSKAMPLTHVVAGLRKILIDGARIGELGSEVGVLLAFALVFVAVGSALFRWR